MPPGSGLRESTSCCRKHSEDGARSPGEDIMRQEQSERLACSIVEFCRFLRMHGLSSDHRRTLTALETAKTIGAANWQLFSFALQAALCSTKEEWELFPQLFQEFWAESQPRPRSTSGEYKEPSKRTPPKRDDGSTVFLDQPGNASAARDGDGKAVYGASAEHRLKKVDFSELPSDDLTSLEELSLRLLRRMSLRLSRRLTLSNRACRRASCFGLQGKKAKKKQAGHSARH